MHTDIQSLLPGYMRTSNAGPTKYPHVMGTAARKGPSFMELRLMKSFSYPKSLPKPHAISHGHFGRLG